jgi:hypothetical protein
LRGDQTYVVSLSVEHTELKSVALMEVIVNLNRKPNPNPKTLTPKSS